MLSKLVDFGHIYLFKFLCTTKEAVNKTKRLEWEKIFENEATGKRLISKICNQFIGGQYPKNITQSKNEKKP